MIKKPSSLRLFGAIVLCFVAIAAFRPEETNHVSDSDFPKATERAGILPPHPLTPFEQALVNPKELKKLPATAIDNETLWLARAIFSETKRPEEQILVAWVIRNRVETGFRGKRTYQDVVLDPYQFSAFMDDSIARTFYLSLNRDSTVPGWQRTLHIAFNIRHLNHDYRPFSAQTRHFYSERSMRDREQPSWVQGNSPLDIASIIDIDQTRFRFYEGIS